MLLGKTKKTPHESLFFQYVKHAAFRKGDWKIVRTDPGKPWELYNLRDDISESKDLSSELPEMVDKLNAAFLAKKQEIREYLKTEAKDYR